MPNNDSPTTRITITTQWKKLRAEILSTNPDCALCGGPGANSIDHITPVALGGAPYDRDNLRPAHTLCNSKAGGRLGNRLKGKARRARAAQSSTENAVFHRREAARIQGKPAHMRSKGDQPRFHADGWVLPRLETATPDDVVGTLGLDAAAWINGSGVLGQYQLRPWQEYVLARALEVRADGSLRWPTVVLTVARQQGKSWLLRGLGWWRLNNAGLLGEPQTVLHVANKASTAREAWEPAARYAEELHPKVGRYRNGGVREELEIHYTIGRESLRIADGSRWLIQAANNNAGVGFSVNLALVDEAWNVKRDVVEVAISPTMSARLQPQMWLVSTAGDSSSDLLRSYRDLAVSAPDGDVLLLEWSAPPDAAVDDPASWRWASPEWDERRATFLRGRVRAMPQAAFQSQYLNQWTVALDGWLPAAVWRDCQVARLAAPKPKDAPVVAVETSPDDQRVAVVAAWRKGERVAVWSHLASHVDEAMKWAASLKPAQLLLPPDLAAHYDGKVRQVQVVGSRELRTWLPGVDRAIRDRRVMARRDDEYLTSHMLSAVAVTGQDGQRTLSAQRSPGPIAAARCLVWAVGETLRPAAPRPVVAAG